MNKRKGGKTAIQPFLLRCGRMVQSGPGTALASRREQLDLLDAADEEEAS